MPKRTAKRQRLTLYSVTRCYGGPEEGGWWYDWYEPMQSWLLPPNVTPEHFAKLIRIFTAKFGWASRYNRYSVLGGDDAVVMRENYRGQFKSTGTPHYE